MKKLFFILLLIVAFGCNTQQQQQQENENNDFPVLSGKYLGQNEPGLVPEMFAPNIVSTGMSELNSCFTPDYSEFFFSVIMPGNYYVVLSMKYNGQAWSEPQVASFSIEYSSADPVISADGRYLYYISKRPTDSQQTPKTDWDIWRVENINGEWTHEEHLGFDINSDSDDVYPCLTKDGTLYFSSGKNGGNNRDIYYARSKGDGFESAVKLSETINAFWAGDLYISPNEDYMIFRSYGRPAGNGLYITFRQDEDSTDPQNMGKEINKTGAEYCPMVDPDGKYFFFTSRHIVAKEESGEKLTYQKIKDDFAKTYEHPGLGRSDIYWVSADIIEEYRN